MILANDPDNRVRYKLAYSALRLADDVWMRLANDTDDNVRLAVAARSSCATAVITVLKSGDPSFRKVAKGAARFNSHVIEDELYNVIGNSPENHPL